MRRTQTLNGKQTANIGDHHPNMIVNSEFFSNLKDCWKVTHISIKRWRVSLKINFVVLQGQFYFLFVGLYSNKGFFKLWPIWTTQFPKTFHLIDKGAVIHAVAMSDFILINVMTDGFFSKQKSVFASHLKLWPTNSFFEWSIRILKIT